MSQYVPPFKGRTMPPGEEIASFATYAQAQHAVDSLSDDGFPVQYLAIVGTDLRQVETITGRMSWGRAVAAGAGNGLWIGMFLAVVTSFLGGSNPAGTSMMLIVLMGVMWGIVFQAIAYGLTRGRRDFTSTSTVVASRYSIIASHEARSAAQALAGVEGNLTPGGAWVQRAQDRRRARQDGPTAFGSRPDEKPRFGVRVEDDRAAQEPSQAQAPGRAQPPAQEQAPGPAEPVAPEDAGAPGPQ